MSEECKMTAMEELDERLKQMKADGIEGVGVTIAQDSKASPEELATGVLAHLNAMRDGPWQDATKMIL